MDLVVVGDSSSEKGEMSLQTEESQSTGIESLPEEILENILSRLSPYDDLDNVKLVSKLWNTMTKKVVGNLKTNFETSLRSGDVDCQVSSAVISESGQIVPPGSWISERFGHMACYYDKKLYVIGGTTHSPTTFNDMWNFDLSTHKWSRCLAGGQYPTPKALASVVQYKDNLILFGGWSHPSPYPLMQPWRIFDELHVYNFGSGKWSHIITSTSPNPSAGHSASMHGSKMVVFGGRTFDANEQAYPLSNSVNVFDFKEQEWCKFKLSSNGPEPPARYGQTQICIDENHALIIGGCGGPNQIFSDVWLLTILNSTRWGQVQGSWEKINVPNSKSFIPNDFQYAGCKVGNNVVFFERSSPISPFLAFLHFDSQNSVPREQHGLFFEPSRSQYFHSKCTSGLRNSHPTATMSIYTLDISKVISEKTLSWVKEINEMKLTRPNERLLYSMVGGRAELILFGGFYKDPNGHRCLVSNDVFIIKPLHKSY